MESTAGKKKSSGLSGMLAPGFRFHPTDEELVRYYLRRKVCGRGFRIDAISEIDVYKAEPWDLPSFSKLKSRDLEWYFFSVLDKKYVNGAKTNRATEKGYWKTTGKDRAVYHKSQIVGMKKTLVYHSGRAPKGQRSNWVMHEYRLADLELERAGISQDAFVLCRVFRKKGSGPKNGEEYGAPFEEEEWVDDDMLELVPKVEAAEEADFGGAACLDGNDPEQILGSDMPLDPSPPPNIHSNDGTSDTINDAQKCVNNGSKQTCKLEQLEDNNFYNFPAPYNVRADEHEYYVGESSKSENFDCSEYLLDEPFFDSSDCAQHGNGRFIESVSLSYPIKSNTSDFGILEHHMIHDVHYDNAQNFAFDPSAMLQSDDVISQQVSLPLMDLDYGKLLDDGNSNDPASASDVLDSAKYESGFPHPFVKQASQCSSKDTALRLNSLSESSSSVHVTAGMIQIRNLTSSSGRDQSLDKLGSFKVILSVGFSRGCDGCVSLETSIGVLPGWLYFILFLVLILAVCFKFRARVSAK